MLNIERILKMLKRGNLTLKNKIIIFKLLALSKITFLAHVLVFPNQVIDVLQQMHKDFLWNSSTRK